MNEDTKSNNKDEQNEPKIEDLEPGKDAKGGGRTIETKKKGFEGPEDKNLAGLDLGSGR